MLKDNDKKKKYNHNLVSMTHQFQVLQGEINELSYDIII